MPHAVSTFTRGGSHGRSYTFDSRDELRTLFHSITTLLSTLEGVKVDQVTIGEAMLGYDPRRITPRKIIHAIEEAGYEVRLSMEVV